MAEIFDSLSFGGDTYNIMGYDPSDKTKDNCMIILSNAFSGNSTLTNIAFPNAIIIREGAFRHCTSISYIEDIEDVSYVEGSYVNIPNAMYIGSSAFCGCSSLKLVWLPNVLAMSEGAFLSCVSL